MDCIHGHLISRLVLLVSALFLASPSPHAADVFSAKRVVNQLQTLPPSARYRLEYPFEIIYGPDDYLYVSERTGRVSRINPVTGVRRVLVRIPNVFLTLQRDATGEVVFVGQDGLMGMALHPAFGRGTGNDFIYVAHVYDSDPGTAVARRARILRYQYYAGSAPTLGNPSTVISGLPAGKSHSSGRLIIGPDWKLYYSVGDLGGNQFTNKCKRVESQVLPTAAQIASANYARYTGKVLRLNLNGTIPAGNPLFNGVRSHIYTVGHRNAQGLVFETSPVNGYPLPVAGGRLYSSEHGHRVDDELNLISAGANYGWPLISGYQEDGNYTYYDYSSAGSACDPQWDDNTNPETYGIVGLPEVAAQVERFMPPMRSLFPDCADSALVDCDVNGPSGIVWPTIAPSSIDFYWNGAIPGWGNSLLVPTLKNGTLYRFKLNSTNDGVVGAAIPYFIDGNRYRDVAINRTGKKIYLLTDTIGATSGPTTGSRTTLADPGSILEFTYLGSP